jgi:glycosyltransferase involved in cell wall biosynthesis
VDNLSVLIIEPYYGGSHEQFLEGLSKHLPFKFRRMTLPARKWKWRMRLAAPHFARLLERTGEKYDLILCSTFLDVATFRGLAPAWVNNVPVLTYFHENQFAYPVQNANSRDFHFSLTNVTTALASDSIAFNSRFNMESFLLGARGLLKHAGDMQMEDPAEAIKPVSRVLPLGLDFNEIDKAPTPLAAAVPVVLWNHRWEHDKNPEEFFNALFDLDDEGLDFGLVVLGEEFERSPAVFKEARERLAHKILHFGYASSRKEYAKWLRRSSIVVSTSIHEFFGISVMEAVRAGCRPLLPRRLSYPEMFPDVYFYDDNEFIYGLRKCISDGGRLASHEAKRLTDAYSWGRISKAYENWFIEAAQGKLNSRKTQ